MMSHLFQCILPCRLLRTSVAIALVLGGVVLHVEAQTTTPAQPAPKTATVHVDITPEHVLNTINPDTATGAWMDDLSKSQVDNLSKPETIQGIKNLGWGSITMRNDPWHETGNLITGGGDQYNGMDNFFTSGLTMGHAALVPSP